MYYRNRLHFISSALKYVSGWGSASDPLEEVAMLPQTL